MGRSERILFVQYAGDFLAAHRLRQETGQETYHAHGYVLDVLADLQREHGAVMMLSCISDSRHDEVLPSGVRVVGACADPNLAPQAVIDLIDAWHPTQVVLLSPMPKIWRHLFGTRVRMLCVFADSFNERTLARRVRYWRFRRHLNRDQVEWVANHGRNACASLRDIGIVPDKIIPWDWPHRRSPATQPSKTLPQDPPIDLFLAGTLTTSKGTGDAITAVKLLGERGLDARLVVAGTGEDEKFSTLAHDLGVAGRVHFLGRIANDEVFQHMVRATAVLVPSHHDYPEGLPLTIYESLSARTPIVASDHPMFRGILEHGRSALVHPAGDASALADGVAVLHSDPELYARLSKASLPTWESIQVPVTWGELVHRWCRSDAPDLEWLSEQAAAWQADARPDARL